MVLRSLDFFFKPDAVSFIDLGDTLRVPFEITASIDSLYLVSINKIITITKLNQITLHCTNVGFSAYASFAPSLDDCRQTRIPFNTYRLALSAASASLVCPTLSEQILSAFSTSLEMPASCILTR